MIIFLSATCVLLLVLIAVMTRSHRRQLRAQRAVTEQALAQMQQIQRQQATLGQDYRDLTAEHRRQYADLGARLEASYADTLSCSEQRWGRQVTEIQQEYDASVARLRVQQSLALARLQRRMPQPQALRLHGDQLL